MKTHRASNTALGLFVGIAIAVGIVIGVRQIPISAQDNNHDDDQRLRAVPFVFVGTAPGCAPSPPGSNIVTSAWLRGMGLPDDESSNLAPANRDPHLGLLLSKNGLTTDCSSAGARILGVQGMTVGATFVLGFDYRNGSHCGGGAPRFNVIVDDSVTGTDTFHFVGNCNIGTNAQAEQDPLEWTTITFTPAQAFPPIPPGSRIRSITLLHDEGTDQVSANAFSQDVSGIGLAVVDNINIDGNIIRRGSGIAPGGNCNDPEGNCNDGR
jgi:hypothetical protein